MRSAGVALTADREVVQRHSVALALVREGVCAVAVAVEVAVRDNGAPVEGPRVPMELFGFQ